MGGRIDRGDDYVARDLDDKEEASLQKWAQKDKEIDAQIDLAYEGILKWKDQALTIGEVMRYLNLEIPSKSMRRPSKLEGSTKRWIRQIWN